MPSPPLILGGKTESLHCRKGPQKFVNLFAQGSRAASVHNFHVPEARQQRFVHETLQFRKRYIGTKTPHVKTQ